MLELPDSRYLIQHPWVGVAADIVLAAVAGLLAFEAIDLILRRAASRSAVIARLVRYTRRPTQILLPLLLVHLTVGDAPDALNQVARLRHGLSILIIVAVTAWVIRVIQALADVVETWHPTSGADNLRARSVQTQVRVLARTAMFMVGLLGAGSVLMTFPNVRQIGASLLASAGVAGIVAGLAARPVLGNLIAGLQIALTQPMRLDDVLIVENEWGRVEEITATYVVVRIWDDRRLIVPLEHFILNPFQNWTRRSSDLIGSVFFWVDFRMPVAPLRDELKRICTAAPDWDQRVCVLQTTDVSERAVQLRALVSTRDAGSGWDLRCHVREELIAFMQRQYPEFLPRTCAVLKDDTPLPREPDARRRPVPEMPDETKEAIAP